MSSSIENHSNFIIPKTASKRKAQITALEVFDAAYELETNDLIDDLHVSSAKTPPVESLTAKDRIDDKIDSEELAVNVESLDGDSVKSANASTANQSAWLLDISLASSLQNQCNRKDAVNLEREEIITVIDLGQTRDGAKWSLADGTDIGAMFEKYRMKAGKND